MELNEEIIKIFIESWLVKCQSFLLFDDQVEKRTDGNRILFQLLNSKLELKDMLMISIEIPKDMNSKECILFAKNSYLEITQVIEIHRF